MANTPIYSTLLFNLSIAAMAMVHLKWQSRGIEFIAFCVRNKIGKALSLPSSVHGTFPMTRGVDVPTPLI